jgi:uncharacterized protein
MNKRRTLQVDRARVPRARPESEVPAAFAQSYPAPLLAAVPAASSNPGSRIHGPEHWARVAEHGARLAAATRHADAAVIRLFALFHDAMRENDGYDPGHGPRAAELVLELNGLLRLNDLQFADLADACERHDRGLVTDNPTVGCCWDADRLDLPRVGATPDPRLLSTPDARVEAGASR